MRHGERSKVNAERSTVREAPAKSYGGRKRKIGDFPLLHRRLFRSALLALLLRARLYSSSSLSLFSPLNENAN